MSSLGDDSEYDNVYDNDYDNEYNDEYENGCDNEYGGDWYHSECELKQNKQELCTCCRSHNCLYLVRVLPHQMAWGRPSRPPPIYPRR